MRPIRAVIAILLLFAALAPPALAQGSGAVAPASLAVPFLSQTEALCGGAAAAMVFRYWGDTHADVQQFAPLVDRQRGGIEAGRLVQAIGARGWVTEVVPGDPETLHASLQARQPVVLLIDARGRRQPPYHFVVAVGVMPDGDVLVHDPTWGPSRRLARERFLSAWQATGSWMLTIRPPASGPAPSTSITPPLIGAPAATSATPAAAGRPTPGDATPAALTACDRAVDEALAQTTGLGLDATERALAAVRTQCPQSSRPLSELAAVRFVQRRYDDAVGLAEEATRRNRGDAYAWDLLGASRFLVNDVVGALAAWNRNGRPLLDQVIVTGLSRTRYARVTERLALKTSEVVRARDYATADRRLRALPAVDRAALRLTPGEDERGEATATTWVTVTAAVVERAALPRSAASAAAMAARTAVERELTVSLPGWTGDGEAWTGAWRWWANRPRVQVGLAAPISGPRGGVWRVDAAWSEQQFPIARDTHQHGGLAWSNWLEPYLRAEVAGGLDSWNGRRYVALGGSLEQRWFGDRLQVNERVDQALPLPLRSGTTGQPFSGRRFTSGAVDLVAWLTRQRTLIVAAGVRQSSAATPRMQWHGAGDVGADSPWLRAHPLTHDGIVDSPVFGRRLAYGSVEGRRWLSRPSLWGLGRLAAAAFVDTARAWHTLEATRGPLAVDAGVGVRVQLPGRDQLLRVDYARDLRRGRGVLSVGWSR